MSVTVLGAMVPKVVVNGVGGVPLPAVARLVQLTLTETESRKDAAPTLLPPPGVTVWPDFAEAAQHAFGWWDRKSHVSWTLEPIDGNGLPDLKGPSLGGAFAVGLTLLYYRGTPVAMTGLEQKFGAAVAYADFSEIVVSATVVTPAGRAEEIRFGAVGDLGSKHLAGRPLVVSTQQSEINMQDGLPIPIPAGTARDAINQVFERQALNIVRKWRKTIARWTLVLEYLLAGNLSTILALVGVLLVSWYLMTEYFWQPLLDSRHEELEYAFLACPLVAVTATARRVRRGIEAVRISSVRELPLAAGTFPPAMLAAMCDHLVTQPGSARGLFRWMGRMLRKADATRSLSLDEIAKAWRRRWLYWAGLGFRTSIPLALAIFLASPWQFYLGDLLARGIDSLGHGYDYIEGGETCQLALGGNCSPMVQRNWPGDVVALRGDAPSAGRLRIRVRNWPRSGRHAHFKSQGLYITDPRNSGTDLPIPVTGRVLELPYFVNDTNTWALWAEIEYFPFRGEKFVTATYSGVRVERDR